MHSSYAGRYGAKCARIAGAEAPAPLSPEAQNGTTLLPVKSWASNRVLVIVGIVPHQMG